MIPTFKIVPLSFVVLLALLPDKLMTSQVCPAVRLLWTAPLQPRWLQLPLHLLSPFFKCAPSRLEYCFRCIETLQWIKIRHNHNTVTTTTTTTTTIYDHNYQYELTDTTMTLLLLLLTLLFLPRLPLLLFLLFYF